jgi:hypothetical protein
MNGPHVLGIVELSSSRVIEREVTAPSPPELESYTAFTLSRHIRLRVPHQLDHARRYDSRGRRNGCLGTGVRINVDRSHIN